MRLEFNYVIIDDDFSDDDDRKDIDALISMINKEIENKGFIPNFYTFLSKEQFNQSLSAHKIISNRIDLYLSDNNLGNSGGRSAHNEHDNDGIQIYLDLKKDFICDFILYTRSDRQEIINKMIASLTESLDPGLFTRFSFIARGSDSSWHNEVLGVINSIIKKREEMNNLRGIFAEKISQIDLHLKRILKRNDDEKFKVTLENIPNKYFLTSPSQITKKKLDNLRQIRNALLHCNEEFDSFKVEYKIVYTQDDGRQKIIYESECAKYRNWLASAYDEVMKWK